MPFDKENNPEMTMRDGLGQWLSNACLGLVAALLLGGCATVGVVDRSPSGSGNGDAIATLTPVSAVHHDLISLPPPKGKISVAVYGFRDQTGQYKPAPDSSFSTTVTQGATSLLIKALLDSNWFIPVEREGLQDLLTERKVIRAVEKPGSPNGPIDLSTLLPASILLEGGIVAYESNVKTGGAGARYLGIGASDLYHSDQVTVNLRAVDIRTGEVLNSISTTKTVFSKELDIGVYKFISFKHLLELEAGYTRNEPVQLCVTEAIESALVHLIVQGLKDNHWALKNPEAMKSPIIQAYLEEQRHLASQQVPKPTQLANRNLSWKNRLSGLN